MLIVATHGQQEVATQTDCNEKTLEDVKSKMRMFKDILNIHYNLMAAARSEQRETWAKILEALVDPVKEMFQVFLSLNDSFIDKFDLQTAGQEFSEMVYGTGECDATPLFLSYKTFWYQRRWRTLIIPKVQEQALETFNFTWLPIVLELGSWWTHVEWWKFRNQPRST